MAILDDLKTYLANENVSDGATGWSTVLSYMPDSPDKIVYLKEISSTGDPDTVAQYPKIQVVVRGVAYGYEAAKAQMQLVFNAFNNASISATYIYCYLMGSAEDIGLDKNNRPHLTIDLKIMKEL
jgi:hypothetical protein